MFHSCAHFNSVATAIVAAIAISAAAGLAQSPSPLSIISTYVGPPLPQSGGPATQAIDSPTSVSPDGSGGFYFANPIQNRIYRVTSAGVLLVIAGAGTYGFSGDGGPAANAKLAAPFGMAIDKTGNIYIADTQNGRIRKISSDGTISTVAGTGVHGFDGDGGPATSAKLDHPRSIAVDNAGNAFVADYGNRRIRKITSSGIITTVVGEGLASLMGPTGVTVDAKGNVFFSDVCYLCLSSNSQPRIRKLTSSGSLSTIAGTGQAGFSGDGGPATSAQLSFPSELAVDALGNLLIADRGNNRIRLISSDGTINTIAGGICCFGGDGGPASSAQLYAPGGVAWDGNAILIADTYNGLIRRINSSGAITTVAGASANGFDGDGGSSAAAHLYAPFGVAFDSSGNLFIADTNNNRIRKVTTDGSITTVAGSGTFGFSGDNGPAISAQLRGPSAIAMDSTGSLYIADTGNHRVRKVSANGTISTIAGTGVGGFFGNPETGTLGGDGGPAVLGQLNFPRGISVDNLGNILIADSGNNRIRRITSDGMIRTLAGGGSANFVTFGDNGSATQAWLSSPSGIATDNAGNVYIADTGNQRIRKVSPSGIITTIVAGGAFIQGFSGDGGPAITATLASPTGIALDSAGNLYIADQANQRIRKMDTSGIITTIAGTGETGYENGGFSGEDGAAAGAQLAIPSGVAVDPAGNVFIADTGNHRIREIQPFSPQTFSLQDHGALSVRTPGVSPVIRVGFGSVEPNAGATTPSGFAIFGFRQNNVLISEASVPAVPLIQMGRVYAEVEGAINTGIAIANPSNQEATITFYFSDSSGTFGSGSLKLSPGQQMAAFLNQPPFNGKTPLHGAFTFSSSVPICGIALRQLTNQRNEPLFTTLPVVDLSAPIQTEALIFPHFAAGAGWSTQIVLVNPTDNTLTGTIQFRDHSGVNAAVTVNGQLDSSFSYSIPPRSSERLRTEDTRTDVIGGTVRVVPFSGSSTPSGVAIFSFANAVSTVSEAGVPAVPSANTFRVYIEASGDFAHGASGSTQTGIAITNTTASAATLILELFKSDGTTAGISGTLSLPANGQKAMFLNQIDGFSSIPVPFQGVLRVSSQSPVSVIGLRGRYNERTEFLMTTIPSVDESSPPTMSPSFFPHLADGNGYATQFVLFNGKAGQSTAGTLKLFSNTGSVLNIKLQ